MYNFEEKLSSQNIEWFDKKSLCIVVCSKGYPDKYKNNVIGLFCDVGDKTSINECIEEGYKKFGRITSVVNNAAATGEFLMKKGELFTDFADFL